MSFESLTKEMIEIANQFKDGKASKDLLKKSGAKLQKKTVSVAQVKLKQKTGNYIRSIKRGKVYSFDGNLSIRTYSQAPHAHLIEYGHIIKTRGGREVGFKKGYRVFEEAVKSFENEFANDVENFIDEVIRESGF